MSKNEYYDELEVRDAGRRESEQLNLLPDLIKGAIDNAAGWARHLASVEPEEITSRSALSRLPVLRKSNLHAQQTENPPFGDFNTTSVSNLGRIFMSPGPIYDPEGTGPDWWRVARALYASGIRKNDIVHNTYSYHLTPAGLMFESGAKAIGCTVIPAGTGNTEGQLDAIAHIKPTAFVGTPDYLKVLLDAGKQAGKDLSSITKACVSGAALPPSLRLELNDRGVDTLQCYGTADLGIVSYEAPALEGMTINESLIVEILTPGTGDPVAEGDVGEIVVTSFNPDYPMIRFATGDMSAVLPGISPCGRTNMRIKGWMGRADQTTKVRGMFVHPGQVADAAKQHGELGRVRLIVGRQDDRDTMTLKAESTNLDEAFAELIADSLRAHCKVRGDVELVEPGSLPNDGIIICDERKYD